MTEKELIAKIKELRQIKPRENWVLLTKKEIFSRDFNRDRVSVSFGELIEGIRIILSHKYAFSSLVLILVILVGVFGFSQKSLPGDFLFSIKKITEKGQEVFVSGEGQLKYDIGLVNKRLDDLTKVAESNSVKNLAPAINEVQTTVLKVAQNLKEIKPDTVKEIIGDVRKIEQRSAEMRILGIEIGENIELDSVLVKLIKSQVDDLEKRSLTAEQLETINEIKTDIEVGKYADALEKLLTEL